MRVREAESSDMHRVGEMMHTLTGENYGFTGETIFVAERDDGTVAGFLSLSVRPWAEGCDSEPVPYIEGWWVDPDVRRRGLGRILIQAAEGWCRSHGYTELGSDAELQNDISIHAHQILGFEPTLRLQFFRRQL